MVNPNPEESLLQGLLNREEDIATAFYERYYPRIYRLMFFSSATVTDAEELTRDSFLAFFESLKRFEGKCKVSTWLYSIAKNTLRNYYAVKKRRKFVAIDDIANEDVRSYLFELEYHGPGPEEIATSAENGVLVHRVLSMLPENYRDVLVHRYIKRRLWENPRLTSGFCSSAPAKPLPRSLLSFNDLQHNGLRGALKKGAAHFLYYRFAYE
jgi:RNA polymerase sigma factor (sigma-70 family)